MAAAIPLFATSHQRYSERLSRRIAEVVSSGRYILGPQVEGFEQDFARYLEVEHCVGVGNGTDALTIAMRALGIGEGDDVVLPSFTFFATVEAVINVGARPVFCDVDIESFCVTAETVQAVLTAETKAILAVDLFGNVAPVADLQKFGLPIVEDAAQAAGASQGTNKAGTLGHVGAFSFFPSKNLFCLGDGGALVTNDDRIAESARMLRHHGSVDKETHTLIGYNSRLDALQAAVLRELLPELDQWVTARREVASAYEAFGIDRYITAPKQTDETHHSFHLYCTRHHNADALIAELNEQGVGARGYYRTPIHKQPALQPYIPNTASALPNTDEASKTNVALPMGPHLPQASVHQVVRALQDCAAI
jgi:dTDP-3-amino-3,4,6-trideoxy-alpha-D-glucose transaminase